MKKSDVFLPNVLQSIGYTVQDATMIGGFFGFVYYTEPSAALTCLGVLGGISCCIAATREWAYWRVWEKVKKDRKQEGGDAKSSDREAGCAGGEGK